MHSEIRHISQSWSTQDWGHFKLRCENLCRHESSLLESVTASLPVQSFASTGCRDQDTRASYPRCPLDSLLFLEFPFLAQELAMLDEAMRHFLWLTLVSSRNFTTFP